MSLVGSATACTAVGYAQDSSGNSTALAEAWDGSHWSIQSTPAPTGGTDVLFDGVSCTTATACSAVGSYYNSASAAVTLAERYSA